MLRRDAVERGEAFNARPYFRLCIGLISELAPTAGNEDAAGFGMLSALASAFHALQPLRVPGFAFSWLELISHRCATILKELLHACVVNKAVFSKFHTLQPLRMLCILLAGAR